VIMKKQRLQGFNGIVNGSYGSFNQYSGDVLLNYRLNKFNLFTGFNIQNRSMQGSGSSERESYLNDTTYYLFSDEQNEMGGTGNGFKAGFDFYPDENNTISLQGNIGSRGFGRSSISQYYEFSMPSIADYYYLQVSNSERNSDFYSLTLNYDHNFGNPEHKIQASLFYSRDNDSDFEELKDTDTDASWTGNDAEPYMQRTLESGDENEFRFNLDYYRPVGEEGKFEAGYQLRHESETTEYLFDLFDQNLNDWSNVEDRNNSIELSRNIQAGYTIFGTSTKIVDFQVGLRAEYTDRVMNQLALDEQYEINRIDLFPSAYLTKQLPFEQQLQLSYSRRINRPREFFLDPFPNYMDPLNIQIGNPELEPEYVDSYELNYQKKIKSTSVSAELYYRQTNNMMSRVTSLRDDNIMIHTMDNIGTGHSMGTEAMLTASPFKWWDFNLSGTMFRYWINGEIEGEDISQQTNTWNARLNNNFKLKWDTRIQIMSFYNAPSVTAQGERGGFFMINAGIRKDFLDNKLSATFQVRDIFSTMKMSFTSEGSNFYTYNERMPQTPIFTISLSYRINNYNKRQASNGSEMNEIQFQDPESF
jgi:outer membrane receptor protein involved in Fe transport